ncbi:MAG: hypothetical protein WCL08_04935, partial [Verrucomicrobiota bacterium]
MHPNLPRSLFAAVACLCPVFSQAAAPALEAPAFEYADPSPKLYDFTARASVLDSRTQPHPEK